MWYECLSQFHFWDTITESSPQISHSRTNQTEGRRELITSRTKALCMQKAWAATCSSPLGLIKAAFFLPAVAHWTKADKIKKSKRVWLFYECLQVPSRYRCPRLRRIQIKSNVISERQLLALLGLETCGSLMVITSTSCQKTTQKYFFFAPSKVPMWFSRPVMTDVHLINIHLQTGKQLKCLPTQLSQE